MLRVVKVGVPSTKTSSGPVVEATSMAFAVAFVARLVIEKREIVEELINEGGDWAFDSVCEAHDDMREHWLDVLCLCKERAVQHPALETFLPYQEVS